MLAAFVRIVISVCGIDDDLTILFNCFLDNIRQFKPAQNRPASSCRRTLGLADRRRGSR
jgi:hypothetical protein